MLRLFKICIINNITITHEINISILQKNKNIFITRNSNVVYINSIFFTN